MIKEILYVSALDENGNLCFAFNEDKSLKKQYHCPNCGVPMILRKSDKVGKNVKRPHFAHKSNEQHDCDPETVLHKTFKNKFYDYLKECIFNNECYNIDWKCQFFCERHSDNLLTNVGNVFLEKSLDVCRPDILLTDKKGKPFVAIEVVVNHEPEENVLQYYQTNNILLYQINLTSDEELKNIPERASKPDFFDYCLRPKCESCGELLNKREILIKETYCWKCDAPMLIAEGYDDGSHFYPESFNKNEIDFATSNGVFLKENYSKTRGESYLSNTCSHCGVLTGNYPLMELEIEVNLQVKNKLVSYYCRSCEYKEIHPYDFQKCPKCDNQLLNRTIRVYRTNCATCNSPIIISNGEESINDQRSKEIYPFQFTPEQLNFANDNGANIIEVRSSLYSTPFYTNVCSTCGTMKTSFYGRKFTDLVAEKSFGHCEQCEPIKNLVVDNTDEICETCNRPKIKRTVIVVETVCPHCYDKMNMAFIKEPFETICFDGANQYLVPDTSFKFSERQKEFAQKNGVIFCGKDFGCPNCGSVIKKYPNQCEFFKEIAHESIICCPPCDKEKELKATLNKISSEVANLNLEDLIIPQDNYKPKSK